ncbi:hypothetical protein KCU78_g42, partial [Aureobasidium melanogenum]
MHNNLITRSRASNSHPPALPKAAPSRFDANIAHFSWPKRHLMIRLSLNNRPREYPNIDRDHCRIRPPLDLLMGPTTAALSIEPADSTEPIDACSLDDATASAVLQQLSIPPKASVHIKGYHNDRANVTQEIRFGRMVNSSTSAIRSDQLC